MTVRIAFDEHLCTGHGLCYAYAPDLVEDDECGRAVLKQDSVPDGERQRAQNLVERCPEGALRLLD